MKAYKIQIKGNVQGVGFRPFIYKIATALSINGCVYNDHEGVWIICECSPSTCNSFVLKINSEKPESATIDDLTIYDSPLVHFQSFAIIASQGTNQNPTTPTLPDLKICADCLHELMDPTDRRFHYPFINCTNCGPRFSIIQSLPYDRSRTTMSEFLMCKDCQAEYEDPLCRRFHAEPIACSKCGPQLQFCDSLGTKIATTTGTIRSPLDHAINALKNGKIIALKGIGGFQLLVDATNFNAVATLRKRKNRQTKPFAVMFKDLDMVKQYTKYFSNQDNTNHKTNDKLKIGACIAVKELTSPAAPIVLLSDRKLLADNINPDNPYLGSMIATSPLHYLILNQLNRPLVTTSGNLSEEPLCIQNDEAFSRLGKIADYFLIHNRHIERPVDDSVIQIVNNQAMILRRARGYAPKTFKNQYLVQSNSKAHVTLALGPHLKNTFTMGSNERLLLSQHIGDLESHQTQKFYLHEIQNFKNFYKLEPDILLHDMHPDYSTTVIANENFNNLKKFGIQHHEAHAWAGIFEYGLEKTDLCIAIWDGAGFGHDGKIWGGEFFLHKANSKELKRTGTLESYLLLGGEKSFHEPWRILLSLLFQFQDFKSIQKSISLLKIPIKESEYALLYQIWLKKINSPSSSSMGRIFDAFSYFLGISNYNHFEGESAMKLQFAAERFSANSPQTSSTLQPKWIYPPTNNEASSLAQLSFQPPLMHLIKELERTEKPFTTDQQNEFSYEFHLGLALSLLEWVKKTTNKSLLVGGGVFQNSLLLKLLIKLCEQDNIKLYYPKEIPINDGGISLGQTIAFYQKNRNLNTL